MLYTLEQAKANIRTREGKRVFFLGEGDTLTSAAKDYLAAERIPILPASQAKITVADSPAAPADEAKAPAEAKAADEN